MSQSKDSNYFSAAKDNFPLQKRPTLGGLFGGVVNLANWLGGLVLSILIGWRLGWAPNVLARWIRLSLGGGVVYLIMGIIDSIFGSGDIFDYYIDEYPLYILMSLFGLEFLGYLILLGERLLRSKH